MGDSGPYPIRFEFEEHFSLDLNVFYVTVYQSGLVLFDGILW